MLVSIADTITLERQVELPETCPQCSRPVESVRLIQLECTGQRVTLDRDRGDLDDWGASEWLGADYIPLGWCCGHCDADLVDPARELTVHGATDADRRAMLALAEQLDQRGRR